MEQVDLFGKPLPPPPPPEDNVFYYGVIYTEVEEFQDENGLWLEKATGKQIITRQFYCEHAEFDSKGYCNGGCPSDHDIASCMDLTRVKQTKRISD